MSQTGVDCTWAPEVCQSWRERPPLGRKVRWEGLGSAVGLGGTGSRKWSSPAGSGSLTLSDWYGLYQSRGLPRRWGQHPTGMLVTGSEVEGRVLGSRAGNWSAGIRSLTCSSYWCGLLKLVPPTRNKSGCHLAIIFFSIIVCSLRNAASLTAGCVHLRSDKLPAKLRADGRVGYHFRW